MNVLDAEHKGERGNEWKIENREKTKKGKEKPKQARE